MRSWSAANGFVFTSSPFFVVSGLTLVVRRGQAISSAADSFQRGVIIERMLSSLYA